VLINADTYPEDLQTIFHELGHAIDFKMHGYANRGSGCMVGVSESNPVAEGVAFAFAMAGFLEYFPEHRFTRYFLDGLEGVGMSSDVRPHVGPGTRICNGFVVRSDGDRRRYVDCDERHKHAKPLGQAFWELIHGVNCKTVQCVPFEWSRNARSNATLSLFYAAQTIGNRSTLRDFALDLADGVLAATGDEAQWSAYIDILDGYNLGLNVFRNDDECDGERV
jgi:hypothetical protein